MEIWNELQEDIFSYVMAMLIMILSGVFGSFVNDYRKYNKSKKRKNV